MRKMVSKAPLRELLFSSGNDVIRLDAFLLSEQKTPPSNQIDFPSLQGINLRTQKT